jgi:hypothetical protein
MEGGRGDHSLKEQGKISEELGKDPGQLLRTYSMTEYLPTFRRYDETFVDINITLLRTISLRF